MRPPPPVHRLEACISRYGHQLQRTGAYLETILPTLRTSNLDDENLQYCLQTIVLMLHTFLEEHYRWLVSLATFWRAEDVRAYLMSHYPHEAHTFEEMPAFILSTRVRREVSFKDQAKKLKGIFGVLFTTSPFANDWAESKCRDLVAVRNIITHQGGMVDSSDVPKVESPEVIVTSSVIHNATFHRLRITPVFLTEVLQALHASVGAIHDSLNRDPRYRIEATTA